MTLTSKFKQEIFFYRHWHNKEMNKFFSFTDPAPKNEQEILFYKCWYQKNEQ